MIDPTLHSPVVTNTFLSQKARLKPVPISSIKLKHGFWGSRLELLRRVTLPTQYQQLEETGRINNFRRAAGKIKVPFRGLVFNDSDIYKWIEAAAWSQAVQPDPKLEEQINSLLAVVEDAQDRDGYLNTYFTFERKGERWANLHRQHELYCAGHLIQAAIAHYRSTGSRRLIDAATRFADYICEIFGPQQEGKLLGTPGHPVIEMALVELTRTIGETKFQEQAQFFLDARGRGLIGGLASLQDHRPYRELTRMEGHAVRSAYLNAGATDIYLESGEPALIETLERLWENMTRGQIYVSGGIGSRHAREDFGEDYELPNQRAYAETCAAIASLMWNWRMLMLNGEARFADLMETTLFNAILVGLGLDGKSYFYVNPLADVGTHRRQPWFECACCPPNIARTLASLPGYFYSLSEEGIWIHLYGQGEAVVQLPKGKTITLVQNTQYPWNGEIDIEVRGEGRFSIFLRIPAWSEEGNALELNGNVLDNEIRAGDYFEINREWHRGDSLRLRFPMPAYRVESHPYVIENAGRVALMRGPILYCLEGIDHPEADLRDVLLPDDAPFAAKRQPRVLDGAVVIRAEGLLRPAEGGWTKRLYRSYQASEAGADADPLNIIAVPYHAWANREAGQMQVWLRGGCS
jgi:DUF1680 family protein